MEFKLDKEGNENIRGPEREIRWRFNWFNGLHFMGLKNCCESGVEAVGKKGAGSFGV